MTPLISPRLTRFAADGGLGVAAEEHAVGEDDGAPAGALERVDDVEEEGVVAVLRRAGPRSRTGRTRRSPGRARSPGLERERRIGHDEVEPLELPVAVRAVERAGRRACCPAQISAVGLSWRIMFIRASAARRVVHLLAVDGEPARRPRRPPSAGASPSRSRVVDRLRPAGCRGPMPITFAMMRDTSAGV